MKNIMILATLALAISPSLAVGMEPAKHTQQQNSSNGTRQTTTANTSRQDANQYHDRTPIAHDRGTVSTR